MLLASALAAGGAAAAERLTAQGARLAPAPIVEGAPFERAVEVGDDEVLGAHALLRPASSNLVLARDRDGFWAPWDGHAPLPETAVTRDGALLTFKLFVRPPEGLLAPYEITLAYRTPAGLRHGAFEAAPEAVR
jgi:hypothetical protein